MGKNKNEVNGVLVYRRWCAGAIFSTLILLLVIAVPVAAIVYNWLIIQVPDTSVASVADTYTVAGLDLIKPLLRREFVIQQLINEIGNATSVRFFVRIMQFSVYGMAGFLGLIAIFGVVEVFFFIFYLLTGRVVSPVAPVKIAWVLFVLVLMYAGLSFGLAYFIYHAYGKAGGATEGFVKFLLAGIMPKVTGSGFTINFFWPLVYVGVSLIAAILLTIVYFAAFRDKFYIGRAKKFGSGETGNGLYGTTNIITAGGTTSTNNPNGQPQVIVVNSTPLPNQQGGAIITSVPNNSQAPQVIFNGQPGGQQERVEAVPSATLPADIRSIGGHAYSKNLDLKYADIPDGIKELGVAAFANCLNLEIVSIPKSVRRIKKNCFFNCGKLVRINYAGTKADWRYIARGSNWLDKAGTNTVVCSDGAIIVDPHR